MKNLLDINPNEITYNLGIRHRSTTIYESEKPFCPVSDQVFTTTRTDNSGWTFFGELVRLIKRENDGTSYKHAYEEGAVWVTLIKKNTDPNDTMIETVEGKCYCVLARYLDLVDIFDHDPA